MKTDWASLNEAEKLLNSLGYQINWCKDQFSQWDGELTINNKLYKVECKNRRFKSDKYATTIVNEGKYKMLSSSPSILIIIFDDCIKITSNIKKCFVKMTPMYGCSCTDFKGTYGYRNKAELDINKFKTYERFNK